LETTQKDAKKDKTDVESELGPVLRPIGVSFSVLAFAIAGVYYLVYTVVQDPSLYPLYLIGGLSLVACLGLMRMTRWGLWLGLLMYPPQVIAPTLALMTTLETPAFTTNYVAIIFVASLVALIFITTLSFLFILDKRKSFK
jgi:hypothetical protein